MTIRLATASDANAPRNIYAQYIETPITFEYVLPTNAEFSRRISSILENYPYLVWEEFGTPLGYAYAHRQMERQAYQWNAELSVYIEQHHTSKGIGAALYTVLIELLKIQGIKTVYAGVTLPNEKSERLHQTFGFHKLGIYHNTGYKCGKWHDVAWFEKQIAPYSTSPAVPISIKSLSKAQVDAVLLEHSLKIR